MGTVVAAPDGETVTVGFSGVSRAAGVPASVACVVTVSSGVVTLGVGVVAEVSVTDASTVGVVLAVVVVTDAPMVGVALTVVVVTAGVGESVPVTLTAGVVATRVGVGIGVPTAVAVADAGAVGEAVVVTVVAAVFTVGVFTTVGCGDAGGVVPAVRVESGATAYEPVSAGTWPTWVGVVTVIVRPSWLVVIVQPAVARASTSMTRTGRARDRRSVMPPLFEPSPNQAAAGPLRRSRP